MKMITFSDNLNMFNFVIYITPHSQTFQAVVVAAFMIMIGNQTLKGRFFDLFHKPALH